METKSQNKKIGLYYGSFNPIHIGHLLVARKALEDAELDEIWFVVSPQNPDKQLNELEDAEHRFNMVVLATEDDQYFQACDVEFDLPQPSYTHMGLRVLREKYPTYNFVIIGGTDLYARLKTWETHQEIIDNHSLVIYPRFLSEEDINLGTVPDYIESKTLHLLDVPKIEISATYIRNQIQKNKSIKYMVSNEVIDYIYDYNLFKK